MRHSPPILRASPRRATIARCAPREKERSRGHPDPRDHHHRRPVPARRRRLLVSRSALIQGGTRRSDHGTTRRHDDHALAAAAGPAAHPPAGRAGRWPGRGSDCRHARPAGVRGGGAPRDARRVDRRACAALQHRAGLHDQRRAPVALRDRRGDPRPPLSVGDAGPRAVLAGWSAARETPRVAVKETMYGCE